MSITHGLYRGWTMAGISICASLIGGIMFGVEVLWGYKTLVVDVGIIRFTFEYISHEDIEDINDE